MNIWTLIDLSVFAIVVTLTGIIIPQILLIAFRKNLFDEIDPRKIHQGAVPRLGGIAFFPSVLFAVLLLFGVCRAVEPALLAEIPADSFTGFCFVTCAIIILYLVGMADDLVGLKYRAKFVAQIFCAALVVTGGIYVDNLHGFIGVHSMPLWLSVLVTILLTVFITNAINLIDGIDGLASGLSAIACAFYGFNFAAAGLHLYAILSFATLGALVPFFYYNVFGNASRHRKIFMGDTGALTIGLTLSVLAIRTCMIPDTSSPLPLNTSPLTLNTSPLTLNTYNFPLNTSPANFAVIAFAPLLIPCFDVVRVYLHRIRTGHNPFLPDKTHIHHKLLALGMSQRLAMPAIVAAGLLLTAANYLLSPAVDITLLFALDLLIWIAANILLSRAIRRRAERLGQPLCE